ncbi:MAG TPA: hypothetical protein VFC75_00505 [Erysipelothrix sp.]|nr:hypothetical protein [Erysipelothrix sp.]
MKRNVTMIVLAFLTLSFITLSLIKIKSQSRHSFDAQIEEVYDNSILVNRVDDETLLDELIMIETNIKNKNSLDSFKKGAIIKVSYDGIIKESYPMQLNKVYKIELKRETLKRK